LGSNRTMEIFRQKSSRFLIIQIFRVTKSKINVINVQGMYHSLAKWEDSNLFVTLIILNKALWGLFLVRLKKSWDLILRLTLEK
jgi:hypothetical protein